MAQLPYRRADLSPEARADDLIARMTLPEKLAQLTGVWLSLDPAGGDFAPYQGAMAMRGGALEAVLKLGVGQISRPSGSKPMAPEEAARALNAFQKRMVEETRLGIPALAHEEVLAGLAIAGGTEFPVPLNMGASFDPDLVRRIADRIRRQALQMGARQGLAPVADVIRDQRWGRVEECISEDPFLTGAMVTAYVQGLQGTDWRSGVIATLKHFAGYSGSEGGRNFAPLHAGERELREIYLLPFEMAIKAGGAKSVMNAYHEIDGIPCAASPFLLTQVLRKEWGFDGFVVADYFAVKMLETLHATAANETEAAAAALAAGLDVELPMPHCYPGLAEEIAAGRFDAAYVDSSVRRVLTWKFRLGLFEAPYVAERGIILEHQEDRDLARLLAERSITLLKNDGILPLDAESCGTIALIGPNAADATALFGNYHYTNHVQSHFKDLRPVAKDAPSVKDLFETMIGPERVLYAEGCRLQRDPFAQISLKGGEFGLEVRHENIVHETSGIAAAVEAAHAADLVLLVLGDKAGHFRSGTVGEATDTDDLSLPGAQMELAAAVMATGKPVITLLLHGRAFALGPVTEGSRALLSAWFPGQEGAGAIAAVVFGAVNPSGKSPVTWPRRSGQQPRVYGAKRIAQGIPKLRDYDPAFPFGHGLSYSRFEISPLALAESNVAVDGTIVAEVRIRNIGARAGEEIVQLYARDPIAETPRPVAELKAFARVALLPGEEKTLRFSCPADLFSFIGRDGHRIVEPGQIELWAGASSADKARKTSVALTGKRRILPEGRKLFPDVTIVDK